MEFRTKLVTFAVLLAGGAALCATMTLVLARGIDRGMASVSLAEDQLALYLTMETNVSDVLRLHITAAATPSDRLRARVAQTKDAVRRDVATIRAIVSEEVASGGGDDVQELQLLDDIEAVLDDIDTAFEQIAPAMTGAQPFEALTVPLTLVVEALDRRLAPLVDRAVAEEAAEVFEARAQIAALSARSVQLGTTAGLLTLLTAVVGLYLLLSAFMRPFGALLEGASRLAQGDLSHRIPQVGRDEFGRLATDFNEMAAELERSDRALRAEEEDLQRRVAARTVELETANARLADQDETRRRFLADVSHELRTPLTVMRGEAEVALRDRNDASGEGAREALHGVVEQSEHMSRLVDDLLFVARREAGEAPLKLAWTELGPLLRRTIADAGRLSPKSALVLRGDDVALGTGVEVDASRIHQLLMVLLDNALRYSPDDGEVAVEVQRHNGTARIAVRDRGIGIPQDEVALVLDRFVRGSNALPGGTGLGLPVAKAIAEAHGGTLSIESRQGEGTVVMLTLPICEKGEVG